MTLKKQTSIIASILIAIIGLLCLMWLSSEPSFYIGVFVGYVALWFIRRAEEIDKEEEKQKEIERLNVSQTFKRRWLQSDVEHEELKPWVNCTDHIWMDKDMKFWFIDETETESYGPYDTQEECQVGLEEYCRSL